MTNNNNRLTGILSGLTGTYDQLAAKNGGLTLNNLKEAWGDGKSINMANGSFASYLQTNFNTIDKNHDGNITEEEMKNLTNMMSAKGFTKQELIELCASGTSGLSQDTLNKITEHFDEMDVNHDGRITNAEITGYDVNSARLEKEDEFSNRAASNMSVFYGDESSSIMDSSSILSYRYKK